MEPDDPTPHLKKFQSDESASSEFHSSGFYSSEFHLTVPDRFNIADAICKRHADAVTRIAVLDAKPAGKNTYTYGGLDFLSDKFATVLAQCGISQGDR